MWAEMSFRGPKADASGQEGPGQPARGVQYPLAHRGSTPTPRFSGRGTASSGRPRATPGVGGEALKPDSPRFEFEQPMAIGRQHVEVM